MIKFEDYESRWEEISGILSYQSVASGAFDKYANIKARNILPVDAAFLMDLERWRDVLALDIAQNNGYLSAPQLNEAVQKTIDRIVFLRIAEDRGLEPEHGLLGCLQEQGIYGRLGEMFRRADKRYNSGMFHFYEDKSSELRDSWSLDLAIKDETLHTIIENLYQPKSPYNFALMPADILGQVYEKFLGRVICRNGDSITVEDKPEVKKKGGVYYTPSFVVKYIISNTVEKALAGKTISEVSGERKKTGPMRFLDPACGSGSFLIELYQTLLDWYLQKYISNNSPRRLSGKNPKLIAVQDGIWRLSISERRRILTDHIYGVDIDPQAVEVARLSLLLKVMEGEIDDWTARQTNLFESRVLPNLGDNIKCGNSLISTDYDLDLSTTSNSNCFNWVHEFSFLKTAGFNVVVGNPPYGASFSRSEKAYLKSRYPHQSYQAESYLLFLEMSIGHLVADGGYCGMIVPNPWLTNIKQANLRKYLFSAASVDEIVHFNFPVFRAKAIVDTEIVLLKKGSSCDRVITRVVDKLTPAGSIDLSSSKTLEHKQSAWLADPERPVNIFLDREMWALAKRILKACALLKNTIKVTVGMKPYEIGAGRPKQTKGIVRARIFDADYKKDETYRQYIRGGDIVSFLVAPKASRYIKYGEWLAAPRLSAGFDLPKKIVIRQTGDRIIAAVDCSSFVCMNNIHVAVVMDSNDDPYNYMGLLNSKLMTWYYRTLNPEKGEALAEVKKAHVEMLPIPTDLTFLFAIGRIAKKIETSQQSYYAAVEDVAMSREKRSIEALTERLDCAVYDFFGVTAAERSMIENV